MTAIFCTGQKTLEQLRTATHAVRRNHIGSHATNHSELFASANQRVCQVASPFGQTQLSEVARYATAWCQTKTYREDNAICDSVGQVCNCYDFEFFISVTIEKW